jgi:hypothetical protein
MGDVVYASAADIVREPRWMAQNTGFGSHRCIYIGPGAAEVRSTLVRTPPAQRSPWHAAGGWPEIDEHFPSLADGRFFLGIEGEVVLSTLDGSFSLGPNDVLIMNAVLYDYANVASDDAYFWTVISKVPMPLDDDPGPIWKGDEHAAEMLGGHAYYTTRPTYEPGPNAARRLRYVPWSDYRLQPITWHGDWGSHWGAYPYMEAGVRGRVLRLPTAQVAEPRTSEREILLFGLTPGADLELVASGARHRLARRDTALVPAGTPFQLANGGGREALVFEAESAAASARA